MINELYIEYIQKSRIFLYPALEIKRGSSVIPIETFVSWEDVYTIKDKKLICLYHLRDDIEFKTFEKVRLFGNPKYERFEYVEDDKGVYVFNLESMGDNYDKIMEGQYSKISEEHKKTILSFFSSTKKHLEYIESYLYPEKYFETYAKILASDDINIMKQTLTEVGELCEKLDFEREDLKLKIVNYDVTE
jgi:hypothetical protein